MGMEGHQRALVNVAGRLMSPLPGRHDGSAARVDVRTRRPARPPGRTSHWFFERGSPTRTGVPPTLCRPDCGAARGRCELGKCPDNIRVGRDQDAVGAVGHELATPPCTFATMAVRATCFERCDSEDSSRGRCERRRRRAPRGSRSGQLTGQVEAPAIPVGCGRTAPDPGLQRPTSTNRHVKLSCTRAGDRRPSSGSGQVVASQASPPTRPRRRPRRTASWTAARHSPLYGIPAARSPLRRVRARRTRIEATLAHRGPRESRSRTPRRAPLSGRIGRRPEAASAR